MANTTPIRDSSGNVVGIEDESRGISRPPTEEEKKQYALSSTTGNYSALPVPEPQYPSFVPPSMIPTTPTSGNSGGGGGSSRISSPIQSQTTPNQLPPQRTQAELQPAYLYPMPQVQGLSLWQKIKSFVTGGYTKTLVNQPAYESAVQDTRQFSSGTRIQSGLYKNPTPSQAKFEADIMSGVPFQVAGATKQAKISFVEEQAQKEMNDKIDKEIYQKHQDYLNLKAQRLQEQINRGEITKEEADRQMETSIIEREQIAKTELSTNHQSYVDEYNKNVQQRVKEINEKSKLGEKIVYETNPIEKAERYGETALLLAPALLPAGAVATIATGAGITAGAVFRAGKAKAQGNEQEALGYALGAPLVASTFAVGGELTGVQRALSPVEFKSMASPLERYEYNKLINELKSEDLIIGGKEVYKSESGSLFTVQAQRNLATGQAKQVLNYRMPVFVTEKGQSFFITRGMQTNVAVEPISGVRVEQISGFGGAGKETATISSPKIMSKDKFGTVGTELPETQGGIGSGYLEIEGKKGLTTYKFIGLSKESEAGYSVLGAEAKSVKIPKYTGQISATGKISSKGTIEKISDVQDVGTVISTGGRTSVKSDNIFQVQETKQAIPSAVSATTQKIADTTLQPIEKTASIKPLTLKSEVMQEQQIKQILTPVTLEGEDFRQKEFTKMAGGEMLLQAPAQKQTPRYRFRGSTAQLQTPALLTEELLQPQLQTPKLQVPTIPAIPTLAFPPLFGGGKTPETGGMDRIVRMPKRKRGRKPKYTASVGTAILDKVNAVELSGADIEALSLREFTGLELRPVIAKRRERKNGR